MLKERYGDLAVTLREHVVEIEIQRPPHNFFDHALIRDLADALNDVDREPDARVVLLCAQGKAFCAGANFANRQASVLDSANPRGRTREHWQHVFGCRRFLVVERDTVSHEVYSVTDGAGGSR